MKLLGFVGSTLVLITSGGCDSSDLGGRVAVSGEVVVDGRPLATGAISLEPTSDAVPTAVGAKVRAGSFAIEPAKGPVPGVYRVRIYASSRQQAPRPPGAGERTRLPMLERIPPEYNSRSNQLVEILRGAPNRLRFDIRTGEGASR